MCELKFFVHTFFLAKRKASNSVQGTSPKETPPDSPSSTDRTELKG